MVARTSLATAPVRRPGAVSWGALAPHEGHRAAMYLFGAEVVGVLSYLLYLCRKIAYRSAAVLRQEVVELEESAQASPSIRLSAFEDLP